MGAAASAVMRIRHTPTSRFVAARRSGPVPSLHLPSLGRAAVNSGSSQVRYAVRRKHKKHAELSAWKSSIGGCQISNGSKITTVARTISRMAAPVCPRRCGWACDFFDVDNLPALLLAVARC